MSDKHAAALAALDAGCYVVEARHVQWQKLYRAYKDGKIVAPQGELSSSPIDALAAAAEALGLEVKYSVVEFTFVTCSRCGKRTSDWVSSYIVNDRGSYEKTPPVCINRCQDEEGAVK